jgi:hypothetical protein
MSKDVSDIGVELRCGSTPHCKLMSKTTRSRRLSKTSVTRSRSVAPRGNGSCQDDQPGLHPALIASTCRAAVTSRQHLNHGGGRPGRRNYGVPTNQDRSGSHSPSDTQHGPVNVHGVKLDKRRTCSQRISFRRVPSGRIERCKHMPMRQKGQ